MQITSPTRKPRFKYGLFSVTAKKDILAQFYKFDQYITLSKAADTRIYYVGK